MTRLHYVKKARKAIPSAGIKKGDSYYWWQFAFRSKQVSKTHPRRSQYLTQSPYLSQIYDIEDALSELKIEDVEEGCLESFIADIENIKDEAESSLDNIPEQLKEATAGAQLQEYIDNLEQWISDLEDVDFSELDNDFDDEAETEYMNLPPGEMIHLEAKGMTKELWIEEKAEELKNEKKQEILDDIQSKMYPG